MDLKLNNRHHAPFGALTSQPARLLSNEYVHTCLSSLKQAFSLIRLRPTYAYTKQLIAKLGPARYRVTTVADNAKVHIAACISPLTE